MPNKPSRSAFRFLPAAAWFVVFVAIVGCVVSDGIKTTGDDLSGTHTLTSASNSTASNSEDDTKEGGLARNVIVFVGDGLGSQQLAAGRYLASNLRMDELAGPVFAHTDSLTTIEGSGDSGEATDSAAAATAMATGTLVSNGVVSLLPDGSPLMTIAERCRAAEKLTGLVTTAEFFDATPAAFFTHHTSRSEYLAIAQDLFERVRPEVIFGSGGWLVDIPENDLLADVSAAQYLVVRDGTQLQSFDPLATNRILGLFTTNFVGAAQASENFTMTPELERNANSPDPRLADMTSKALARLARGDHGFFLLVEDEIFDQIGHRAPAEVDWANRALGPQVLGFDAAIGVAIDWVKANSSFEDTLIVVLADHETGGYQFDATKGPASGVFTSYSEGADFPTGLHTRRPIEVRASGPGAGALAKVTHIRDVHHVLLGAP
jgi:alkaline phosphatase